MTDTELLEAAARAAVYIPATKPAAKKPVLAWDGLQWVRAMWVPKHSKEQNGESK